MAGKRCIYLWAALAAAFAVLPYLPLLKAGLVFDDKVMAASSLPLYRTIGDAFVIPPGASSVQGAFFRPLLWLTFMLDRAISSSESYNFAAHAMTLFYQLCAVLLFYALALELYAGEKRRVTAAGVAALVYASLPAHLESAATATARTDVLATLFGLAALLCVARWLGRGAKEDGGGDQTGATLRYALPAALFLLLAALGKEVGVASLALMALVYLNHRAKGAKTPDARQSALFGGALALSLAAYLGMRAGFGTKTAPMAALPVVEGASRLVAALGFYLQRLTVPLRPIIFERDLPQLASGAAVLALALAPTAWALRKGGEPRRVALFCWGWFLAALAPSLLALTFPMIAQPVADRFLYLPSAAWALLIGWLALRAPQEGGTRHAANIALALVIAAYAGTTFARTPVWQSERTYWEAAVADPVGAKNSNLWLNVGNAQKAEGDSQGAIFSYRRALTLATELYDRYPALFSLASSLLDIADDKPPAQTLDFATEAAEHLQTLAALPQRHADALGPGVVQRELAFALVRAATAQYTLSGAIQRDKLEIARQNAQAALAANPDDPSAAASLQRARQMLAMPDSGVR